MSECALAPRTRVSDKVNGRVGCSELTDIWVCTLSVFHVHGTSH